MKKYVALSLLVITGLLVSCAGGGCYGPQNPYGWGAMMHYRMGYGGFFMWILFLIVVVFLIYFIVQTSQKTKDLTMQSESALDLLKKRYAKGEITGEEYEKIKKDLE